MSEAIEPDTPKASVRIHSIDILKGAAILGVVLAHLMLIQNETSIATSSPSSFQIGELFYAALPMFLVISGYFYKSDTLVNNLRMRIVPFVIFFAIATVGLTLIMYGYLVLLGYDLSGTDLWGDILNILVGKGAFLPLSGPESYAWKDMLNIYEVTLPFYFLQIMIVGYLIFYPIADFVLKSWKRSAAAIIILLTITCVYVETIHLQLPFYAQLGPLVAALYITGAFMAKHHVAEYLETGFRERKYWIYFIITLVIAMLCIAFVPTEMGLIFSNFGAHGGYSVYSFYLTSMSCGMVLFFITALLTHVRPVCRALTAIGRETLPLFVLHIFFAKMLVAPFIELTVDDWVPVESIPQALGLSILVIAIIIVLVWSVRHLAQRLKNNSE